jgi:DNA-binding winged helix-turn-helix (wHTH) protein
MLYRFGAVEIDTEARQVRRAHSPRHLTRKAFELLGLLLHRRPAVVSKEDIHTHLWPDTFVSESSVQALISELRRALDEDGERSAIRTAHGVGYAWVAEVVEASGATRTTSAPRAWLVAKAWRLPLHPGVNIVGRGSDDVVTLDSPSISRRHARIVVAEEITLEDLGSKNGTWLRDERVDGLIRLRDGDVIRFGSIILTLRLARGAESTDTHVGESPET